MTFETYLIRVWLPDRPGALGLVASRLGALRGDVQGLEIVERSGGRAIDELVVRLPADVPIELIAREVSAEDDVEVEDIRLLEGTQYDPQLDILEAAAILLGSASRDDLAQALAEHVRRCVRTSWTCVLDQEDPRLEEGTLVGASGAHPSPGWLSSFVAGSPANQDLESDVDTVWIPLPSARAALVVGRSTVLRARERQRLAALARIADAWFRRLGEHATLEALLLHPSRS
jgi:hypothetical protein